MSPTKAPISMPKKLRKTIRPTTAPTILPIMPMQKQVLDARAGEHSGNGPDSPMQRDESGRYRFPHACARRMCRKLHQRARNSTRPLAHARRRLHFCAPVQKHPG
mgnify:CR=1 FL=1